MRKKAKVQQVLYCLSKIRRRRTCIKCEGSITLRPLRPFCSPRAPLGSLLHHIFLLLRLFSLSLVFSVDRFFCKYALSAESFFVEFLQFSTKVKRMRLIRDAVHVLIGDWLNRVNQAEQSERDNEQSVKELEEQLMETKYLSQKSPQTKNPGQHLKRVVEEMRVRHV